MKKFTGAGIALLLGTTAAYAGGMDRSGQSITALFEEGTYAEISFGSVSPDVTGESAVAYGGTASGGIAPDYTQVGFAFKTNLNEDWSLAIIMDQPFGVSVDYATPGYIVYESGAEVKSTGFTILAQYHVDENVSVYGGPRMIRASGFYQANDPANGPGVDYRSDYSSDTDVGFVLGAAYEIPEIALRAAVTYSSETSFEMDGTLGDLSATMPQSVNVDFQTGIAANTLAFANIRWAEWSEATIDDLFLASPAGGSDGNLADFGNEDVTTYTVGVGRRFSDNFAAQFAVSYEKDFGAAVSNLSPTDGYMSYSIGGAYTFTNGMELSGGIRYVDLGDATTEDIGSSFTDNSVTAIGVKLAYNY